MSADVRNKQITLKRIQRLCSAALPMATFAMTLFDLVGDAIPHGDIRIITADFENHRWLTNVDISSWGHTFSRLLELPPEVQGITMDPRILSRKELWRHEELEVGSFERSGGYNEFARHIGFHHVLSLMLRGRQGQLGNYPIWRRSDMKPFSREDREFATAITPHLNHALAMAAHPGNEVVTGGDEQGFSPLDKHQLGLVTIDTKGRILAANRAAHAIFYSLLLNDDLWRRAAGSNEIGDSLRYIAGILKRIFLVSGDADAETPAPVMRLMNHPSGYQLRLRGYAADGEAGKTLFVTVEAGETRERLVSRIIYRYGLNRTQAELLALYSRLSSSTRTAVRPAELAAVFGVRPDTLKKSLRRLADRLGLDGQKALRHFSHGLIATDGSVTSSLPQAPGH